MAMTQAQMMLYRRFVKQLGECVSKEAAERILIEVALHTGFTKKQRIELVNAYKESKDIKFICLHCSERFKTMVDLDAHLFNNKHCNNI